MSNDLAFPAARMDASIKVRLSDDLAARLERQAARDGLPVSVLIRRYAEHGLAIQEAAQRTAYRPDDIVDAIHRIMGRAPLTPPGA